MDDSHAGRIVIRSVGQTETRLQQLPPHPAHQFGVIAVHDAHLFTWHFRMGRPPAYPLSLVRPAGARWRQDGAGAASRTPATGRPQSGVHDARDGTVEPYAGAAQGE
ncbi:hypothetical protein GCM10010273_65790 [Streptomyces lavendulocolor]